MANLGDIKVRLILEVLEADKNAKKYSTSLKSVEVQSDKTTTATKQLSAQTVKYQDSVANAYLRVEGFRTILSSLGATFGSLIQSYFESEVALNKLANGMKNVGEGATSLKKLTDQASALQEITTFDDDAIINAQSMLTTFMKSSQEIEILTPRMLDLAAAYQTSGESGMDLQQVAVMLGKINEDTIGALTRVGVAFTKEQAEKLKSTKGTEQAIVLSEILDKNFKGMAKTIGDTAAGQMQKFKYSVGDMKKELGKLVAEGVLPLLKALVPMVQWISNSSEPVKKLTLGVLALAAASVALGSSFGRLPYIIGGVLTVIYALPSPLQEVAIAIGILGGALKLLGADMRMLIGLFPQLTALFPKLASAAVSSAGTAGAAFGAGGLFVAGVTAAIWYVAELIDKIKEADRLGRELEAYQKKVREGSFVSMYDPNAPSDETIKQYEDMLKRNPNQLITIDGVELKLSEEIVKMKELNSQSKQFGKTWEEMSGQTTTNIDAVRKSSKELGDEINKLNESLSNMNPNDASLQGIKTQRDLLLAEKKKVDDLINPPGDSKSSSKGPGTNKAKDNIKDFVSFLAEQEKKLADINEKISKQSKEESEAEGLFADRKSVEALIDYIKNLEKYKKVRSDIITLESSQNRGIPEVILDDETSFRIMLQKQREEQQHLQLVAQEYDKIVSSLQSASQLVSAIADKFEKGGKSWLYYMQATLQVAIQIAKLTQKANTSEGIGIGDILGTIGTILPFFLADGGAVPGSGSGDTVPAMLTPGEYVINKSSASRLGAGFLNFLNGGGQVLPAVSSGSSQGGGTVIINLSGQLTDHLRWDIVNRGSAINNLKVSRSRFES